MSARDYLTTREVAKQLGVSVSTVQVWVASGVLPAWKTADGHRRLPLDAVDKLRHGEDTATAMPLAELIPWLRTRRAS